jgi:hypothetical protein
MSGADKSDEDDMAFKEKLYVVFQLAPSAVVNLAGQLHLSDVEDDVEEEKQVEQY